MCIIIVKRSGVSLPKIEYLNNCESNNPDGIGIAHKKYEDDLVFIKKDFKNSKELDIWINTNVGINDNLIIHFRLATHGIKDMGNRHPFPVTNNKQLLRKFNLKCRIAVAHNGIISQMPDSKKFSDTQKFIINILADNSIKYNLESPAIRNLLQDYIGTDKLALLTFDNKIILFGDFIEDDGLLYSNNGYQHSIVRYVHYGGRDWINRELTVEESDTFDRFGWYDICEYCQRKTSVKYIEVNGTGYMLCRKCRKKAHKNKLDIDKKQEIAYCIFCDAVVLKNKAMKTTDSILCNDCYKTRNAGVLGYGD